MFNKNHTRRQILKMGPAAIALGVAAPVIRASQGGQPQLTYRTLGKTGMKITTVSLGCMVAPEEVIAKAGDMGINWFDTAHGYKGGKNEAEVGRAMKGRRNKVYISTKIHQGTTKEMLDNLDISLKRLQTDYVDNLFAHGLSSRDQVFNEESIAALQKAKKEGKTRFIGVSSHSNMAETLESVFDAGVYDTVLVKFNYSASNPRLLAAIEKAAAAGIGITAMKTQLGDFPNPQGGLTPHQAALKWVLENKNISCAVPGTRDFQQLDANLTVMGQKLALWEERELDRYVEATADLHCSGCGSCNGLCPHGVEVTEVRRCSMYMEGYRDNSLARENYRQLAGNAAPCVDCEDCVVPCTRGTSLQPLLSRTHQHLV